MLYFKFLKRLQITKNVKCLTLKFCDQQFNFSANNKIQMIKNRMNMKSHLLDIQIIYYIWFKIKLYNIEKYLYMIISKFVLKKY